MGDILGAIKQAVLDAVKNADPTAAMLGEVISISPLEIQIEQRLTIDADQIILTRNVTKHVVQMTFSMNTGTSDSHSHSISGTHDVTIKNALKKGDKVLLIRQDGGQKFFVLDRVVI